MLTASAVTLAVAVLIVLMGALAVPLIATASLAALTLALCVPAAKLLARLVEDRPNTFTIGGASFVGLLAAPWLILLTNETLGEGADGAIPMLPTLAALAIAYAFGEGTGRLACISFGCCYGKPLSAAHPALAGLFRMRHFAFAGPTKKAAYEGGLESAPVIPVQAVTAVISTGAGLVGLSLFLHGRMQAAFLTALLITHAWRVLSERFRADHRGGGDLSVYQVLAALGSLYGLVLSVSPTDERPVRPDLLAGLEALWNPFVILSLQAVWVAIFLYTGRGKVTASTISLSVLKDRV